MSLTKTDLKAIKDIVTHSLDQAISERIDPRFDDLEMRIGAGFNEMSERFDGVDERIDRVEERLSAVELETSRLSGNVAGLNKRVSRLEAPNSLKRS